MSIRVIAMDMDGTLLNSKKQITPKTKEMLLRAQKSGMTLILASGRPTPALMDFARELCMDQYHGLLVAYNGSQVADCQSGDILFNQAISVEESKAVLEHLKKFDRVRPMIDRGAYMYVNNVYDNIIHLDGQEINIIERESRGGNFLLCEKRDLAAFVDFPVNKILTAADPEYLQEHYQAMLEPFQDTLNGMFTARFYYEFTAKGIDKAKALDAVLPSLGIQREELLAFGDAQNDASMIRYAGLGIAMENAVPELKAIADGVTGSCDEDGIASVLEDIVPAGQCI